MRSHSATEGNQVLMQQHRQIPKHAEYNSPKPMARAPDAQVSLFEIPEQAELGRTAWLPGEWDVEWPGKRSQRTFPGMEIHLLFQVLDT